MTERLLSASQKPNIFSGKRILTGIAIGLSTVAFAACGKDTSKEDNGSDKITSCPTGYVTKDQQPITDRSAYSMAMGNAVTQLASRLTTDYAGNAEVLNDNIYTDTGRVQRAAVEVFHVRNDGDPLGSLDYFEIDNSETKVDDLSEQFCTHNGQTYESARAARAVGAMDAAGIDVAMFDQARSNGR